MHRFGAVLCVLFAALLPHLAAAEAPEARLALVIGEANYKVAPLATPLNDAGLVAASLKEAGFAVTEGADLDGAALRKALHDFVLRAQAAGPNGVLFVYLSGRGLQFAGQNYFVPVDARVEREADIPVATVRLADYLDRLTALPAKARIFVFDGARILHFATEGAPFASGFGIKNAAPKHDLCLQRGAERRVPGRARSLWPLRAFARRDAAPGLRHPAGFHRGAAARQCAQRRDHRALE